MAILRYAVMSVRYALRRSSKYTIILVALFAAIFLVRFLLILPRAGPPSEDLGEDLVMIHTYTQTNPVFPDFKLERPPLYYLLVDLPLNLIFPSLLAQKLVDALVPSMIIFPFYFLCKLVIRERLPSCVSSYLFAFSEAFNQIMGWGGMFNTFAFMFALPSVYYFVRLIQEPSRRNTVLVSLFLSLTIGSHQLTALYTTITLATVAVMTLIPRLELRSPIRAYGWVAALTVLFSTPYIPIYLFLISHTANLFSNPSVPLESLLRILISINAQLDYSVDLLISCVVLGAFLLVRAKARIGLVVILASTVAALLLIPSLNSTIYERVAYFLPIPFFLLIAAVVRQLLVLVRLPKWPIRLAAGALIALIVVGFSVGDYGTLTAAIAFNQHLDGQTLQALDWLSIHTSRNDSVYSNYPALGAWIAGYSERNELTPKLAAYSLTSTEQEQLKAANVINAGNYVFDGPQVTIGDFFPATIYNPAVYLNLPQGPQGLLYFNDDYQNLTYSSAQGTRSLILGGQLAKNAVNGTTSGASNSFVFSYSGSFGQLNRTVSITGPNTIKIDYSIISSNSTSMSFVSRMLAFTGESFDYSSPSTNNTLVVMSLPSGQQIPVSITYSQRAGQTLDTLFSSHDNSTSLPTFTIRTRSTSSTLSMDLSITLPQLYTIEPLSSYSAFNLMKTYSVKYILLDLSNTEQTNRFIQMMALGGLQDVFQNSEVEMLRMYGNFPFGPFISSN
jgi:hypothetical protein